MDPVLAQLAAMRVPMAGLPIMAPAPMLGYHNAFANYEASDAASPSISAAHTQGALDALALLARISTDNTHGLVNRALLAGTLPAQNRSADALSTHQHAQSPPPPALFQAAQPRELSSPFAAISIPSSITSSGGGSLNGPASVSPPSVSPRRDLSSVTNALTSQLSQLQQLTAALQAAPAASPAACTSPPAEEQKHTRYWSEEEHERFLVGLQRFGSDHKAISEVVGTRTVRQVRSHSQKFFLKVQERAVNGERGELPDMSRKKKKFKPTRPVETVG
mmetsp:Transcript_27972/g.70522  ORF Transcript_27972/g.70522 Transcript_27972/m.70522 type:complete len:277 (+) Transcript_27972:95-925(+)